MEELTFGQKLCGINFNPSKDSKVDRVKEIYAELADMIQDDYLSKTDHSYIYNLIKGNALGEILNAQMNCVKLLTLQY